MQLHLRRRHAHWQPWVLGVAVVLGLLVAPAVMALTWLAVLRGVLF